MSMKNIAIFASGSGTNAENIINYFNDRDEINIPLIVSNKPDAYVLSRAKKYKVPTLILNKKEFYETDKIIADLYQYKIDVIVLAGFLWLIPTYLINAFTDKIINLHPALLPKFGGKGMYGSHVHQAVIDAKEKESGITIHVVNEIYDEGKIIFQAKCVVNENDTPETLSQKIHQLEYKFFPLIIERFLLQETN